MSTGTLEKSKFRVFSKEKGEFVCRVCGSDNFEEKYEGGGFGRQNSRTYCFCSGCSVVFLDPEKFSLK